MVTTPSSHRWVKCFQPNPKACLRLFCFPYAGGSALNFRDWSRQLPETVEVCPIELPGRGFRMQEKPFTRMLPLVQAISSALRSDLDRPFAFFGHSMGGLVSFEVACWLRQAFRLTPVHLFISGVSGPQLAKKANLKRLHTLSDAALLEELRHLNGTPQNILDNAELMELLLPILRADFAVTETYDYTPEPPLNCPITVFGGLQDHRVGLENLEAWRTQTESSFVLKMFPGDHFFLHTAQSLLLHTLAERLSESQCTGLTKPQNQ